MRYYSGSIYVAHFQKDSQTLDTPKPANQVAQPDTKPNRFRYIVLVLWLIVLGSYFFYSFSQGITPRQTLTQLYSFMSESRFAPLIFISLYVIRPLLLFSVTLITLLAGALFGPFWGVLYALIGELLSASIAYIIGYFFGEGLVEQASKRFNWINIYGTRMRQNSFETVLTMRFIFLPFDLVNYLAGFLRIHYISFILATLLGSLPSLLAVVFFGASTKGNLNDGFPKIDFRVLAASAVIFLISILIARLLRARQK